MLCASMLAVLRMTKMITALIKTAMSEAQSCQRLAPLIARMRARARARVRVCACVHLIFMLDEKSTQSIQSSLQ